MIIDSCFAFGSRNNFLLWVTDWSRSTFVIIHRWIAFICILQACIHSALFLQLQLWQGVSALATESAYAYWYWGVIATWALVLVLPLSLLPVRQRAYEFFLAWHNLFVLLAIIASFLHIFFRYHWQWGYEIWVCVIFSILAFDRVVARPLRLACNGCHRQAFVSVIDGDYLKLEIPGADAKGQAFLYFPTLTWRIWENHPFSVVPMSSGSLLSNGNEPSSSQTRGDLESGEDGKVAKPTMQSNVMHRPRPQSPGIAFFVRRRGGLTATLARHAEVTSDGIPVLIESSYGQNAMSVLGASTTRPSLSYPNVICIAGGVGITGVLPLLDRPLLTVPGTTKLFWCVRTQPLVRAVEEMIGDRVFHGEKGTTKWGGAEVTISVGKRLLLKEVLEKELATVETKRGTTVIVCGPAGMLDEVRVCVCELARKGAVLRFVEESSEFAIMFIWVSLPVGSLSRW
ncbi:hypothetical protein GQ53DRAFT_742401 [Thozetella sp. PMI_491]|nr:hypothetical protein GQ53DRAFT_742401 [Thozetella sp. PMI_491]